MENLFPLLVCDTPLHVLQGLLCFVKPTRCNFVCFGKLLLESSYLSCSFSHGQVLPVRLPHVQLIRLLGPGAHEILLVDEISINHCSSNGVSSSIPNSAICAASRALGLERMVRSVKEIKGKADVLVIDVSSCKWMLA